MSTTRRQFLKTSLGASTLLSLGGGVPEFLARAAMAGPSRSGDGDRILIVMQLAGGNDGLNSVVPYGDDVYGRSRTTLRLPASQLHKIDSYLGFHPKLRSFRRLYDEGRLSVVQGVGYPGREQSHDRAMAIWQTAHVDWASSPTGWLGRAVEQIYRPDEAQVPALFAGQIAEPQALRAQRAIVPAIQSLDDCTLRPLGDEADPAARQRQLQAARPVAGGSADPLLDFVRRGTVAAHARSRQIQAVARAGQGAPAGGYPQFQLATMLRVVAQLIRAEVGIRIYYTELGGPPPGGFDNHAGQLVNHAALLEQLAESVAALVDDLARDRLLDRVLLMTFSDFGRTLRENGRHGTDHGTAAPLFLAGGALRPGLVGAHPSLTDLDGGEMRVHTDFRRVYASLLDHWLGIDSQAVLGAKFAPLPILKG
jgi:uncharacterized protein (DUF1501 family)